MYDPNSCNALEKPFYTPLEAAIRWCGLINYEEEILLRMALISGPVPPVGIFPQWPCLRVNVEKILYAMDNGELNHGRDGRPVADDDHVAIPKRTVTHSDLKAWIGERYPDQKPKFLFDDIERTTHSKITVESWQALQADRDALKTRVEKAEALYRDTWSKLEVKAKNWQEKYEQAISEAKPSHLLTIAALLELQMEAVAQARPARNQAAIITTITEKFKVHGLGKRNLDDIFADANRAMAEAKKAD